MLSLSLLASKIVDDYGACKWSYWLSKDKYVISLTTVAMCNEHMISWLYNYVVQCYHYTCVV